MTSAYFAMIKDPYAHDLRIRVFRSNDQAQQARRSTGYIDSQVIRFMAIDLLLEGPLHQPIYLATTHEDEGLRIHAAFGSLLGSRTFLMNYSGESTCRTLIAWPDPLVALNRDQEPAVSFQRRSA